VADFRATTSDHISLTVGETRTLESLRQAVVPPFVLILPFVELPPFVRLLSQDKFEEDGIHGCLYTIEATGPGSDSLRIGFRDLRTRQVVKERTIRLTATVGNPGGGRSE